MQCKASAYLGSKAVEVSQACAIATNIVGVRIDCGANDRLNDSNNPRTQMKLSQTPQKSS